MIKTVLFDVDGVLLSENHYFDSSALTVWELLFSPNYLGLAPEKFRTNFNEDEISEIRHEVFQNDSVLAFLKSRGLNANWDMIYLTFSYQLILILSQIHSPKTKDWLTKDLNREALIEIGMEAKGKTIQLSFHSFEEDFQKSTETKRGLFRHLDVLAYEKLGVETELFQSKGALWSVGEHVSQEWYVGDDHVLNSTGRHSVQTGKRGFLSSETTLCHQSDIELLFKDLTDKGISLGIGTGRPELETLQPFQELGWIKYFDKDHIATADDVLEAERSVHEKKSLAKPHPFTYIRALFGKDTDLKKSLNASLPIENAREVLIVGDSLADLLAAREMGCTFAAVLTGLSGPNARSEFKKYEADYILDNVLDVIKVIKTI